jgi:PAS domain S-box-containing protein
LSKSARDDSGLTRSLAQLAAEIRLLQQQVTALATAARGGDPAPAAPAVGSQVTDFLINGSSEGILAWDGDCRCTIWNPALVSLSGMPQEAMLGRDLCEHLPDFFGAARATCLAGIRAGSPVAIYDQPYGHPRTGERGYFDATFSPMRSEDGSMAGGIASIRDATSRKNAERALMAAEGRFRVLVESVVDYAIIMLDPDGCVANWNAGAERIKGYKSEEIVGEHFSRFYGEDDRLAGLPAKGLAVAERDGKYLAEGWRQRKDGSRFWASVVIDAIRDPQGTLIGFAKVTRDESERREAQAKLDEAREQLFQSQKMEAIGKLTGGIAHDFNNLLTVIAGNLDLLGALADSDRMQRLIGEAQRATDRGARLTEHLLSYSRRQNLHPEPFDVNQLLIEFQVLMQRAVGESVEVNLDLENGLWPSRLDRAQFESAMLNLAVNARDAISGSGKLTVTTRNVKITVPQSELPAGEYVLLAVSDTGGGMSSEVLTHAFEPFFTTKEVGKGSGLGLSMVFGFAKQSGGTIRLESTVGLGTTAQLYLPRTEDVPVNAVAKPDLPLTQDGSATVLVVEDDEDVRQVAVDILEHLGYRVLVAENGIEALSILSRDEPIRLLFSDVVMPGGLSGIELAREVRRLHQDVRILLTSGYTTDTIGSTAEFTFFRKPYRPADLARKISDLLGDATPAAGN